MTEDEIMAARTPKGGWTKKQLAEWGMPWPPPKGWIEALVVRRDKSTTARQADAIPEDQFIEAVTAEIVDYFNGADSRRVLEGEARLVAVAALRRYQSLLR
jgi:hypothetical protein